MFIFHNRLRGPLGLKEPPLKLQFRYHISNLEKIWILMLKNIFERLKQVYVHSGDTKTD